MPVILLNMIVTYIHFNELDHTIYIFTHPKQTLPIHMTGGQGLASHNGADWLAGSDPVMSPNPNVTNSITVARA